MEQTLVSTFMFSDPHEQELLWLKFNVEDSYFKQWIITESSYTFRGQRKPIYIHDILAQPRFEKFRHKVHVIELNQNYNFEYEIGLIDLAKRKLKRWLNAHMFKCYEFVTYAEKAAFHAEINQRQAVVDYLKNNYVPTDLVIACDTDEIFDFNEGKIDILRGICKKYRTPLYIRRQVYCYDYNNVTNRIRFSPIVKLENLLKSNTSMHDIRHPLPNDRQVVNTERLMAYEYTFCFSKDAIMKKLSAFAHVSEIDNNALEFCLSNNISLTTPEKITDKYLSNNESFLNIVSIDNQNTPLFLRENFERFRTDIVDPKYKENRDLNGICQR